MNHHSVSAPSHSKPIRDVPSTVLSPLHFQSNNALHYETNILYLIGIIFTNLISFFLSVTCAKHWSSNMKMIAVIIKF